MAKEAVKKKRLPKHKRKSAEKKAVKESDPLDCLGDTKKTYNRDFTQDLKTYLCAWKKSRDSEGTTPGEWKFNKILQTWALDNCFDKKKIDGPLFKELLPYIITIKGGALDRMATTTKDILDGTYKATPAPAPAKAPAKAEEDGESPSVDTPKEDEKVAGKSMITRAKVIDQLITVITK